MKPFFFIFVVSWGIIFISLNVKVNAAAITVTATEDNAAGSLREAIATVNANGEDNVIYLLAGTYYLQGDADEDDNLSGDLDIFNSGKLMIIGAGKSTTIIDGNQADRVLHIISGEISISHVTIRGGETLRYHYFSTGERDGGGIYNSGTLTLENCVISDNATGVARGGIHTGGPGANGGGIYNDGTLSITNCLIENNRASDGGVGTLHGSHGGHGGGIMNEGKLTINTSTISGNTSGKGATTTISKSGGDGGGIYSSGTLFLSNSIIASNRSGDGGGPPAIYGTFGGDGGGMYIEKGYTTLKNCTVTGNSTGNGSGTGTNQGGGGSGGGIAAADGLVSMYNCTICANFTRGGDADEPPAVSAGYGGGIYCFYGSEVYLESTIAADNQVPENGEGPDCCGTIFSYGYNLIENTKNCTIIGNTEKNIIGVDPMLGPLQDNGGPTMTHALLTGSPAIDAGIYVYYPFDQRGYQRPVDVPGIDNAYKGDDIGAYEYNSHPLPIITVNREILSFSADTSGNRSPGQTFIITNSGQGILNWGLYAYDENMDWLSCSPTSGTHSAAITVTVDPSGLIPGFYPGEVRISGSDTFGYLRRVKVILMVYEPNAGSTSVPFGVYATPVDGTRVSGSIPVTGWVLDDIGVQGVGIFREEGKNLVFIGDAVFVEGARPDVEQTYPGYPMNYKAGWGYMMLTNFLPNSGNGTFKIHAVATDVEGNQVTLGMKTIICDNANAVKPFGAIDTPTQGGASSGSGYINFGWVLTPPPNSIPTDGSTIRVWVDGVSLGNPVYNNYREDIAVLFPGYNNSGGAGGYFYLDTTQYENGVHTIQWTVTDDAGNTDGIGSRYFSILNSAPGAGRTAQSVYFEIPYISKIPVGYSQPLRVKKGYNPEIEPQILYPGEDGVVNIRIRELERLEIQLSNRHWTGFQVTGSQLRSLPIGSALDRNRGVFTWQPGPGYLGDYELIFIEKTGAGEIKKKHIIVRIFPYSPN